MSGGGRISRRALLRAGALTLVAGGSGLLAACTGPAPTSASPGAVASGASATPQPKIGGQAVIASGPLPDTFFAGNEKVTAARVYNKNWIGDGLVRVRRPEWIAEPDLAESWTISPDGLTYTFKLRRAVKFHDGQPFGAADVKFTFEYLSHPKFPVPPPAQFALVAGAKDFRAGNAKEISGITTSGDDQVRFSLTERNALFLNTTASTVILPQHILKEVDPGSANTAEFGKKPLYTGPFMLDEWKPAEFMSFKANTNYFLGRPYLDSIIIRVIPDPAAAVQMLRTGEILWASVSADVYDSFANNAEFSAYVSRSSYPGLFEIDLTKEDSVLRDVRVRQALSHAIDRDTYTKTVLKGLAEPGLRFINNDLSPLWDPNVPTFPYDPTKAKALLDQAGWKPGPDGIRVKDGRRLEFLLDVFPGSGQRDALGMLPMVEAVGMTFRINTGDFGAMVARLGTGPGKHEVTLSAATGNDNDPRLFLAAAFETPRAISNDRTGFHDSRVDQLFKQARAATTPADEKKAYDEILMIAGSAVVYVYTWVGGSANANGKKLVLPTTFTDPGGPIEPTKWYLR